MSMQQLSLSEFIRYFSAGINFEESDRDIADEAIRRLARLEILVIKAASKTGFAAAADLDQAIEWLLDPGIPESLYELHNSGITSAEEIATIIRQAERFRTLQRALGVRDA